MKRILLWSAGMFALGEVTYICRGPMAFCMAMAMLICVALSLKNKGRFIREIIHVYICFALGFIYFFIYESFLPVGYDCPPEEYCIEIYGIVTEYSMEKDSVTIKTGNGPGSYKIIIYALGTPEEKYNVGDRYALEGVVSSISAPSNPGVMDMKKYYYSRNIIFTARGENVTIKPLPETGGSFLQKMEDVWYGIVRKIYDVRNYLINVVKNNTDEQTGGFITGILFGDKAGVDSEIKELFLANGIGHILVISGLHVSLIGDLLYRLLSRCFTDKRVAGMITSVSVILYGIMAGAGVATIRAVIMLLVAFLGEQFSRDYDMLTAMSMALAVMIIKNPFAILDGGMVLSFGAIGGIALGDYLIKELSIKKIKPFCRVINFLATSLIMSCGINLVLTPIICNAYYGFPLYSILINLIVTSVFEIMVIFAIAGVILSIIIGEWGRIVFALVGAGLRGIISLCSFFADMPFSYINTGYLGYGICALCYLYIIFVIILVNRKIQRRIRDYIYCRLHVTFMAKKWHKIIFGCCMGALALMTVTIGFTYQAMQREIIVFADVGQGDGILIRTGQGCNMVIDGGSSSNNNLGEYVIAPMLKYYNMVKVDYWFVSHTDKDHITGLIYVLQEENCGIEVDNIIMGENYKDGYKEKEKDESLNVILNLAKERGVNIIYMNQGDYVELDNRRISCVAPVAGKKYEDKNQSSLGLLYTTPDMEILFTGDMDSVAIDYMLDSTAINEKVYDEKEEKILILKVPHHGSKYSINRELYNIYKAQSGVISCGKNNKYGHPHNETMEALETMGIQSFCTDRNGAVIVKSDRKGKITAEAYGN